MRRRGKASRQAGKEPATKIGFLVGPGPRVGSIRRHTGDG